LSLKEGKMERKFSKFTILLIFIASFCCSFLHAQNQHRNQIQHRGGQPQLFSIKGKVVDWDADYVNKAVVLIPEIGKSVETDESGTFEFTQIPKGKYHIEVYAEGFLEYSSEVFFLNESKLKYNIVLSKLLTEQIVVTATRTPKLYAETPVRTDVISSRDIEMKSATNLAEALYQTSGVRVENDCQNCNFTQVRINGMEGKYSQILIDSSPVVSAMSGVYGLEQIPAEMLERIEIVKGGGSALYGGNAIAGVINVITKQPKENKIVLKLHQEAISGKPSTNFGFHSSLVSKDLNTKAFLFASYQNRDPVDLNDDSFSELGTISNTSFGLNFYNYFSKLDGNLKLSFFRIFEERRGGDLFEKPPHEASTAEWIKTDQIGISSEWNHSLSENIHYNLSLSFVDTDRNTYYGSHQDLNAYGTTKNPLLFVNGQLNYQAGNHVFSLGIQHKQDKIKDEATGYNRIIEATYYESGLFIQDDFKIGKACSLFTGMIITNSPDLKEETSFSLSSGLDYGRQSGQNVVQMSIEGFYNKLFNTFILHEVDRTENARVLERINGLGSKVYGFSLEFGVVLGPILSLSSGWTFQQSWLDEPEPEFNSREFFRTPNTYGYASMSHNNKLFKIELSLEYTGKMKAPHYAGYIKEDRLETTHPFWVMNTKLHKKINFAKNSSINVFFGIFNLLDSYQKDLDMGANRDSGYVYGPAKPRSFYAGFQFSF
jgi:outer membrane receptor for ferrienterochelin and colicins